MKTKLLFVFACAYMLQTAHAQKEMLTKEETVNYLNKKIKEIIGYYRTPVGTSERLYFWSSEFVNDTKGVKITTQRSNYVNSSAGDQQSNYNVKYNYTTFNPAQISSITLAADQYSSDPVGVITITLTAQTAIDIQTANGYGYYRTRNDGSVYYYDWKETDRKQYYVNQISMPYLKSDGTNFDKIRKALEHLRNLAKAEDDPFGK
jgi:hypothetical protein